VERVRQAAPNVTRIIAIAVLVPTVPLLIGSVGALLLFYLSPERFGRFLERLPGDDVIRSALVFAPATLFAVVVLAVLYALERPLAAPAMAAIRKRPGWAWADWGVVLGLPLLLVSAAVWVARFIAPGRFAGLLDPLPGTAFLQRIVTFAPPLLFSGVLFASIASMAGRSRGAAGERQGQVPARVQWERVSSGAGRMAAGIILIPALPLLLFSLGGLGLYLASPELLETIVEKLSQATVIRLALIFTPAVTLALVLMAGLYLFVPGPRATTGDQMPKGYESARQIIASVILLSGIGATALIGLGMLGAIAWLLLR
jgi:hypothetical protein